MKLPWPFILLAAMAIFAVYDMSTRPAQAAAEPVPQCPAVATTPNLSIYYCEPDNGPPFYINSYGFMLPLE